MRSTKLIILLMTLCTIGFSAETSVNSFSSSPILVGGGVIFEIAEPTKHIPGAALAYRNYLANKMFSLQAGLDYFPRIHDDDNQLDLSIKLSAKLLHQGEVIFHIAGGPGVRLNFDSDSNHGTFSVISSVLLSADYKLNDTYILETAVENKFGFSRKPDTVLSFKVYRSL